ncbi:hypothetical protein THOB06_160103 [Vibrio rotiferianus]|nr:hypothetical protein THOB06_160103 [Vibrio rotiferianus]
MINIIINSIQWGDSTPQYPPIHCVKSKISRIYPVYSSSSSLIKTPSFSSKLINEPRENNNKLITKEIQKLIKPYLSASYEEKFNLSHFSHKGVVIFIRKISKVSYS